MTGWSTNWGNSVITASGVYAGASSVRVGTAAGGVNQEVMSKLSVGSSYTLSFAAKLGSTSDRAAEIGIEFFNSSGTVILDRHVVPASTSWSAGSVSFTVPSGATSALVYVYKGSGSSYLYADSFNLSLTSPASPANLLGNSGFESGLTGWSNWGNSVTVSSPAYAGSASLRAGVGSGGVYQDVASKLRAGSTYTLSAVAGLGSASDHSEIGIEFFNSSGTKIYDKHIVPSATSFTAYNLSFTAPAGFTSALVYVYKGSGGTSYVYVDAMSLTGP